MSLKSGFYALFGTLIGIFASASPAQAFGPKPAPEVYLMGVLGDSISAGTLADTSLTFPMKNASEVLPAADGAVTAQFIYENKSTYSWASGQEINSHFVRLKRYIEKQSGGTQTLEVANVAIPGEKTPHLAEVQVDQLIAQYTAGNYAGLKYVTMLIGANDACQDTDNGQMADYLRTVYRKLAAVKTPEPIKILVSTMPKIPDLGEPNIEQSITAGFFSCHYIREVVMQECNPLTEWSTQADYEDRVTAVATKNQVIQAIAEESAQTYASQLQIAFTDAFYRLPIDPTHLALDCFHPNQEGQQLVSDILWAGQPWFK